MKGSRQERHALEAAVLWCLPQMAEYTQGRSILQALFVRHCSGFFFFNHEIDDPIGLAVFFFLCVCAGTPDWSWNLEDELFRLLRKQVLRFPEV